jgi:superfamily II DNA/RNA helicase
MVYVQFTSIALDLADLLDCLVCHVKLSDSKKEGNVLAFKESRIGCIITTTALTEGIHFYDVDTVVRIRLPALIISYN